MVTAPEDPIAMTAAIVSAVAEGSLPRRTQRIAALANALAVEVARAVLDAASEEVRRAQPAEVVDLVATVSADIILPAVHRIVRDARLVESHARVH